MLEDRSTAQCETAHDFDKTATWGDMKLGLLCFAGSLNLCRLDSGRVFKIVYENLPSATTQAQKDLREVAQCHPRQTYKRCFKVPDCCKTATASSGRSPHEPLAFDSCRRSINA
eukprot:5160962-Amphidinium_carterae.1